MLKAIAAAFAKIWQGFLGCVRWTEQLIRWPFSVVFGSGGGGAMPRPEFTPCMTSTELLDEYEANCQAQAVVYRVDREGIDTVMNYAAASAVARSTVDLSAVRSDARMTLLTMDDHELSALSKAGPSKVRRWIEGQDHGIFGVPNVQPSPQAVTRDSPQSPRGMTPQQQMLWRVQARLGKPDHSKEFKLA
ncbi:hypothetical protein [Rhizobium leguminosarum]|uniref:hypothetical protein n=1 Tax=Rhizobium leguminosarum TaxID=384 RepID=UPI003F95D3BA